MSQIKVKRVSIRSVINSREFAKGFADGRSGASWPKNIETTWEYERGRQFGVLHPDILLKSGRRVTNTAIFRLADAVDRREII